MSQTTAPAKSEYDDILAQRKKIKRQEERKRNIPLYLMMLPGLLYLIANNYLPMFGILIAFKKVNFTVGLFKSPWCGFDNFEYLFKTKDAFLMIRNTVCYNLVWIALGLVISVFIAICMAEISSRKIAKVIQPVICFPSMVSAVILSFIVYAFLSTSYGYLNATIFKDNPVNWYATAKYWPLILTIVHFWQNAGQSSIIYMASIGGIDKSLYESARLDGATKWQQIWHVTLPGIRSTIIILLILNIGRMMSIGFDRPYIIGNTIVKDYCDVISTFVYRIGIVNTKFDRATAVGLFQSVIGMILVTLGNTISRLFDEQGIW
jgi:putative aldouronate transport system permease protein